MTKVRDIVSLTIWRFVQKKHYLKIILKRILILDLDVHQGDGTAKIFQGDERVYTVSLHGKNNFPFRKQVSDWDIEFENDTEDEEYLETLDQVLLKLSEKEFDLVFFQAGVDGLASDALGLLKLSREGMKKRNEKVFQWRKNIGSPMSIFMGGGYAKPIEDTIDSFCDLFIGSAQVDVKIFSGISKSYLMNCVRFSYI